jgi:predicted amidohydrolase YtcJ
MSSAYTEHTLRQIKLYLMGNTPSNDYWGSQIPRLINYGLHKRLTVRSIKLFADGALGSWGAALIAPYTDKPDTRGLLRTSPETLRKLAERFYEDDFQVVRILAMFRFRDYQRDA